jgi:hypothetical protein
VTRATQAAGLGFGGNSGTALSEPSGKNVFAQDAARFVISGPGWPSSQTRKGGLDLL